MAAARCLVALVLLAVAATALAPGAAAQTPGAPQPCGTARLTASLATLSFEPGETQSVVVNAGLAGATQGFTADAVITLALPPGWTSDAKEARVTTPASGEAPATFRVTAPDPMASGGRSETLQATGAFTCFGTLGTQRQAVGAMPAPAPLAFTLQARAPTSAVPFMSNEMLLAGGAVGLVLIGAVVVFAVARRRGTDAGLRLACTESDKRIRPGRGVSYPLRVENAADKPDQVRLEVTDVPEGWTAFMATTEVQLAPRETRIVWLMVRAPSDGTASGRVEVGVRAHSTLTPREQPALRVSATVTHEPLVTRADEGTGVVP